MARASTTQRGYGHAHQQNKKALIYNHDDGTECAWCGEPMYKEPAKNWDGHALEGDHNHDDGTGKPDKDILPKRLLHKLCNIQKADTIAEHGPGWYEKHGLSSNKNQPIDWPGGRIIDWQTLSKG